MNVGMFAFALAGIQAAISQSTLEYFQLKGKNVYPSNHMTHWVIPKCVCQKVQETKETLSVMNKATVNLMACSMCQLSQQHIPVKTYVDCCLPVISYGFFWSV